MTLVKNKLGHVPTVEVQPEIFEEIKKSLALIEENVRAYEFKAAVDNILLLAGYGNSYISNAAPWKLLKEDVPAAEQVLKNCLQIVKACALVMQPVMPESSQKLWEMLGYTDLIENHPISDALVPFENTELGDVKPLFPRIEDKQREDLEATLAKRCEEAKAKAEGKLMTETVIEPISEEIVTIDDVAKGDIRNKIRDLLGAFMFGSPEASMKKVKVLSGGERTRLAMIKLLLEPVNLLILDEPTNHLDMKTKDILKQALVDFDGTLIVVSHDRDFLDGLVTKVYEFGNKKVKEHLCGIYEFLETKKLESLQELERKK